MRSKVSELLEKINRLTASSSFPKFSQLEFDLLMEYVRELYSVLDSLKNSKEEMPETTSHQEESPSHEIIIPADTRDVKKEEAIVTKPGAEIKIVSKSSLNEVVKSPESLHSKLAGASSKEIHHKLSTKPLKELLDLNKRFVVVNELFDGNKEAFSKAVNQIDSADDFNAAGSYIHSELVPAYKWDESSLTVKLFLNLVKQKFGVNY